MLHIRKSTASSNGPLSPALADRSAAEPPTGRAALPYTSYLTRGVAHTAEESQGLYSRFAIVPGANQARLQSASVALIGAGGLGGELGLALARQGVGHIIIADFDEVDLSNLPRQQFTIADLGKNKALALAAHMRDVATGRTLIEAYGAPFEAVRDAGKFDHVNLALVGVDNNPTRLAAAEHFLRLGIPVIFLGVNRAAAKGYTFVQTSQPGEACFRCLYPEADQDTAVHGCAGASIEILKITVGMALYAAHSLLMDRPRPWNMKTAFLDMPGDGARTVAQRPDCPLCGQKGGFAHTDPIRSLRPADSTTMQEVE